MGFTPDRACLLVRDHLLHLWIFPGLEKSCWCAFYHGSDLTDFFTQIKSVFTDTPWLPPFQLVRGVFWSLLALPVIRMMKGQWWEAGIAVALCFGVLMSSLLLIPNPLMPKEVRLAHLWETASSNFLFGWMVVIVLVRWGRNRAHNSTDLA